MKITKFKSFILLASCIGLLISLSACSGSDGGNGGSAGADSKKSSAEEEIAWGNDTKSLGDEMKEAVKSEGEFKVQAGNREYETGGGWPDYEFFKGVPKPSVGTVSVKEEVKGQMATVALVDMSLDECKEYAKLLPGAGFNQNILETDMGGMYVFSADSKDGLHIDCGYMSELVTIKVSVIKE